MKKNKTKDQEQKKPRRLNLNRETIWNLNDPALLELARGRTGGSGSDVMENCCQTTSSGRTSMTITMGG